MENTKATPTLADRLKELFPEASGVSRKSWLARGRVMVNGQVIRDGHTPLGPDDRVALGRETVPRLAFPRPLRLVHEDEDLLVIEKPPRLLTIATAAERERTAYHLVWDYLAAARPPRRPFIVHRLDRETSGLLVIAKSLPAKRHLQSQFAAHSVTRGYLAMVEGRVEADRGALEDYLREDRALRVRRAPRGDARGRLAVTRYQVRQRRGAVTVLDLTLGTGRRHQIRVQLAARGHPVVGDRAHGAKTDPLHRLCLHATTLGFRHPSTGKPMLFETAAPDGFIVAGR